MTMATSKRLVFGYLDIVMGTMATGRFMKRQALPSVDLRVHMVTRNISFSTQKIVLAVFN